MSVAGFFEKISGLKSKKEERKLLKVYIHQYVYNLKHRSRSYKRSFLNLAKKIEAFENENYISIYTDSFCETTAENFVYFLKEKYNHRANSVRTMYQKLSRVLRSAHKAGYKVDFRFEYIDVKEEYVPSVSLSPSEIERIYNLYIKNEEIAKIRDRFIIGCCTALRYSDYSVISSENCIGNNVTIKTKKTGVVVVVPQHRYVREILAKYNFHLPALKSQQNFNKVIKNICKRAGIDDLIRIERTVGVKIERKNYKKWELVSSHTARRSGATNMYLAGIPVFRIMLLTGHSTEKSFFKYICISKEENASVLAGNEFFK